MTESEQALVKLQTAVVYSLKWLREGRVKAAENMLQNALGPTGGVPAAVSEARERLQDLGAQG